MATIPAGAFYNGYMIHKHMRLAKEEEMRGGQSGTVVPPTTQKPKVTWSALSSYFGRDSNATPALGSAILNSLPNARCDSESPNCLGSK